MAKISQLSTLTTVVNTTILPVVDTGTNYKITASQIKEYTNTSIPGANVSGYVPNANIANTAYSVAGANVSGAVTYATTANAVAGANVSGAVTYATTANAVAGANVSGAVTYATTANSVAGANVSGTVSSATTAGTVTTAAQGNITSVGTLTDLSVSGNATITGNLTVSGTTTTINSTTVSVNDLNLVLANNASTAAAADGAGITINGASASMNYVNSSNSFTFSHKIVADGSLLTSLTGANVTGQVGNALVAGTVYTAAQPNITSTGTLTSLTVNGNANFTGTTTFTSSQDVTVTGTPAAGVVAYDLYNGVVFDVTPSANWTANISNIATTNNRTSVVTFIITQGATPYVPNVFQISGVGQTVKWINGTTPSGTASKTDVVSYSMIRSSSGTWTVLGQSATYG